MAHATLPATGVDWDYFVADYGRIRDKIEAVFPHLFDDFNEQNPPAGRLPSHHPAARSGVEYRHRPRQFPDLSGRRGGSLCLQPRHAPTDDAAQSRPVQHDDLQPERPLSRRIQRTHGSVHERSRYAAAADRPWNAWSRSKRSPRMANGVSCVASGQRRTTFRLVRSAPIIRKPIRCCRCRITIARAARQRRNPSRSWSARSTLRQRNRLP